MDRSRRQFFFKTAGALSVATAVPGLLAGCELGDSTVTGTGGTGGNQALEEIATALQEANGVHSASDEGRWPGKAGKHAPTGTWTEQTVAVACGHEMAAEHWIDFLWLRRYDPATGTYGPVVGFKHFVSQGAGAATMAAVEFVVPASVEAVVAFTHCNLHDTWRSEPILRG